MTRLPVFRMVPMLIVMGTIFYLSSRTFTDAPPLFPGADKVIHLFIYAVLGATILFAQSPETRENLPKSMLWVVLIATLYGVSDEFHQSFIPGRQPDIFDIIADSCGAVIVSCFWYIRNRFSRS